MKINLGSPYLFEVNLRIFHLGNHTLSDGPDTSLDIMVHEIDNFIIHE